MSRPLRQRYLAILNEAILENSDASTLRKKGDEILKNGVFLKDKKLFYWMVNNQDCYIVLASSLTFSDQYDSWVKEVVSVPRSGPGLVNVEEERLEKSVRWLEVKGSFSTVSLQLYTTYKVTFRVKVWKTEAFPVTGELPVELSLVLPSTYGRQERINYDTIKKDKTHWIDVHVGKFWHNYRTMGTMYFSMKNTDATWKGGISVMGVCVMPDSVTETKDILNWTPVKL